MNPPKGVGKKGVGEPPRAADQAQEKWGDGDWEKDLATGEGYRGHLGKWEDKAEI